MFRLLIVGTGATGLEFARLATKLGVKAQHLVFLSRKTSKSAEAQNRHPNALFINSINDLAKLTFDQRKAYIAVPTSAKPGIVNTLISLGFDCLVEKPVGIDGKIYGEYREIGSHTPHPKVFDAMWTGYNSYLSLAVSFYQHEKIVRISSTLGFDNPLESNIRTEPGSGGCVGDLLVYQLYIVGWFLGDCDFGNNFSVIAEKTEKGVVESCSVELVHKSVEVYMETSIKKDLPSRLEIMGVATKAKFFGPVYNPKLVVFWPTSFRALWYSIVAVKIFIVSFVLYLISPSRPRPSLMPKHRQCIDFCYNNTHRVSTELTGSVVHAIERVLKK